MRWTELLKDVVIVYTIVKLKFWLGVAIWSTVLILDVIQFIKERKRKNGEEEYY